MCSDQGKHTSSTTGGRTPPRSRRALRRPRPGPGRRGPAATHPGLDAAAEGRRRPAGPRRRRHLRAAAGRPHLTQRILCHTYGRGKDQHVPVPGWPYSIVCALEPGRSSWTAPLDALRLAPGDDTATVTARKLRDLVERLTTAGQRQTGTPDVLVIADAGYDAPRLAHLLRDLPVQVPARMRSDRVLRRPAPPRKPHTRGRPARHCGEFVFGQPDTRGTPDTRSSTCPAVPPRSRSGCGGQAPTQMQRTPTGSGRHTCGASTSSTPSACSSRPSAGPA